MNASPASDFAYERGHSSMWEATLAAGGAT